MKRAMVAILAAAAAFAAWPVCGQVSLEISLNRSIYMQYEPVFVQVKMRNFSGQPLVFGKDPKLQGELRFDIRFGNEPVPQIAGREIPVTGLLLLPGATREFVVPVGRFYRISRLGTYRLHAYVKHAMLKEMFKSNDCRFEVNPGVSVWTREVGIPDVLRAAQSIPDTLKTRTYSLRMMVENATKYYYLVIEDKQSVYAVLRVGREVGMERYRAEVDMLSRLHLMMPIAPKLFRYMIIGLNGRPELDKYMKSTAKTIPSLVRDPATGQIYVAGGADALPGIDYQPQKGLGDAADGSLDSRGPEGR